MKNLYLLIILLISSCQNKNHNNNLENQQWSFDSSTGDYIEWQSDNDFANEMTNAGFVHLYNFEYDKATVFFEKALEYDPTLFGPHVVLAGFSVEGSDKQKMHIEKAKETYSGYDPLQAKDIAECIAFMLSRPRRVNIGDMIVLPLAQASSTIINRQRNSDQNLPK